MINEFGKGRREAILGKSLEELLRGVADPEERDALIRAWNALEGQHSVEEVPIPSKELARVFCGESDQLSDDDLGMVAAAGIESGNLGNSLLKGTDGKDVLFGDYNEFDGEPDSGVGGEDTLYGEGGDDYLFGQHGNDLLDGGAGDDKMYGGADDDTLHGGDGNDTLIGGADNDMLVGGAGSDVFVFGENDGTDRVADFDPDNDTLRFEWDDLEAMTVSVRDGNTVIAYGETRITLENVQLSREQVLACLDDSDS